MGKIQKLSEQLTNQIAAGEVVKRPVSVVKELVENALDTGSTQIDIFIEEADSKAIQIIDNDEGVAKEDVLNVFKCHATSKIHTRDDLFRIRSLGFWGEALPDIASVSEMIVETATTEEKEGSYVILKGGKVEENRPAALRKGTKVTVPNLFYNTPARLKYVKAIQTELANIDDIVNRLTLSHPKVAFRLVHDGHKMMSTIDSGDLKQTTAGIYGISTAKKTLKIEGKDLDFTLTGYVSLPEVTRASHNYLSTIINGRYIKDFALNKAIIAGYGSKLMVGRFPIAASGIEVDPLLVDVSVHPAKQETRLNEEKDLMASVEQAIQGVSSQEQLIPNVADNLRSKKKLPPEPRAEQMEISLSTEQPTARQRPGSLSYNLTTGHFYAEHAADETPTSSAPETVNQTERAVDPMDDPFTPPAPESTSVAEETSAYETPSAAADSANHWETASNEQQVIAEETKTTEVPDSEPSLRSSEAADEVFQEEMKLRPEFDTNSAASQRELKQALNKLEEERPTERFPELEYFG